VSTIADRPAVRRAGTLAAVAALTLALVVVTPRVGAEANGCQPAGGADVPFATSQEVKDAGADIAVNGGGWGHGLGMSQYGAKGAALLGCTHEQILTTYFPGTSLADSGPVPKVRVGLVQKHTFGEVTAESAPVTWKVVDCADDPACEQQPNQPAGFGKQPPVQPQGVTWRVSSRTDGTFVITQTTGVPEPTVVWQGGDRFALLRAQHEGTVVRVALQEGGGISHRRVRHGHTEFDSYADEGGRIYAVQVITPAPDGSAGAMERYLWGLAEVPTSWPKETLKAQAVAGRSYAQIRIDIGNRAACRCHIYATTSDQFYLGWTQEENDQKFSGGEWKKAVSASANRVLTYEGKIADTFYSSSHGGSSDDVDHVWVASIPYVTAVDTSRWETVEGVNNPNQRWSVGFTYDLLAKKFGFEVFQKIEIVTRAPGGHPTRKDLNGDGKPDGVRVVGYDAAGTRVEKWLSGEQFRWASTGLGLKSSLAHIEVLRAPGQEPPEPEPEPAPAPGGRTGPTTDHACPRDDVPEAGFGDVDRDSTHGFAVDCAVWWEVANGRSEDRYEPLASVRRDQMAAFIARTLDASGVGLPEEPEDHFGDDDGTTHELAINQLAELGLVGGTDAEARTYAPELAVTRAQMAAFLVRAYEHVRGGELEEGRDHFGDDEGNTHEADINKARSAWIATGTSETTYEPAVAVTRGQMASFLARLLDGITAEGLAAPPGSTSS
jgi:SpoIID/LytB domain protein